MKKSNRNSSIELLRILAMCGVVFLHYNGASAGGGLAYSSGINRMILMLLESVCIGAVNLYVLISGYFLSTSSKRKIIKPVELIVQVSLFSGALYALGAFLSGTLTVSGFLSAFMPNNYFVTLYVTLYLISPYVNILLERLSGRDLKKFVILMLVLFSLCPTILYVVQDLIGAEWNGMSTVGAYGSQWGYTVVNFLLMYIMGAYIRRNETTMMQAEGWKYVALFITASALIAVWSLWSEESAWAYCNPLVVISPCALFLGFLKLSFHNEYINRLARSGFTCFLAHGVLITRIGIPRAVCASLPVMLGHILISITAIYMVCYIVYLVWSFVTRPVFRVLDTKMGSADTWLSL